MAVDRINVPKQDQWNVEALFVDMTAWEQSFSKVCPLNGMPKWPALAEYKGRLGESAQVLKEALELQLNLSRELSALYTYAHLRHDEDITENSHKAAYNRILALCHDLAEETSWFEPELLALSSNSLEQLLADPLLSSYKFHLEKIIRIKQHMLNAEGEELLAMAAKAIQAPAKVFSAINDADFKFGTVADAEGKDRELTHGLFGLYIRDRDRTLRENAFRRMHGQYHAYENTLCELIGGEVQGHLFNAKARRYASCLEAALFPKNIDLEVYHSLIKAVNDNLGVLHSYVELRERVLGVGQLHLYDMYVPLISTVDIRLSFPEAEDVVIESVAPLGAEYQNLLKKGLKEQRWTDRFENKNKRSGAYSSGCYGSMPYILMNYKGVLRDVFTLAHEAGHSMHSLYSRKHQPYHYSEYPIFLAEVASTFNEELLMQRMLERAKTKEERIFLINEKIEDIRGTLFRQTMFAEFELLIHQMAEKNIPMTPQLLKEKYRELNRRYFGERVAIDEEAEAEWARIPHFYYNFYVFQYATGISAALALADRVVKGGSSERDAYLSFLKAGSSRYPIDILRSAGVDMRATEPVAAVISKFGRLVKQLGEEMGVST